MRCRSRPPFCDGPGFIFDGKPELKEILRRYLIFIQIVEGEHRDVRIQGIQLADQRLLQGADDELSTVGEDLLVELWQWCGLGIVDADPQYCFETGMQIGGEKTITNCFTRPGVGAGKWQQQCNLLWPRVSGEHQDQTRRHRLIQRMVRIAGLPA